MRRVEKRRVGEVGRRGQEGAGGRGSGGGPVSREREGERGWVAGSALVVFGHPRSCGGTLPPRRGASIPPPSPRKAPTTRTNAPLRAGVAVNSGRSSDLTTRRSRRVSLPFPSPRVGTLCKHPERLFGSPLYLWALCIALGGIVTVPEPPERAHGSTEVRAA